MGYGIDGYTISENECSFIKTENWDELDVLLEANKSHWLDTSISYSNAGAMNEICDMCQYLGSDGIDSYYIVPPSLKVLPYLGIDVPESWQDEVQILIVSG